MALVTRGTRAEIRYNSRRMRILHVTHAYPPDSIGGAELHLRDLVAAQAERHEVLVLARRGDPAAAEYAVREERRDGARVRLVVNNYAAVWREGFERSYLDPRMRAIFEETLRAARPDVVHLQHLVTLSSDLALAARAAGVGCVLTLHDFWPLCQRGNLVDWGGRSCGG